PPRRPLVPYTPLFRSEPAHEPAAASAGPAPARRAERPHRPLALPPADGRAVRGLIIKLALLTAAGLFSIGWLAVQIGQLGGPARSEEHTSELQSRFDL